VICGGKAKFQKNVHSVRYDPLKTRLNAFLIRFIAAQLPNRQERIHDTAGMPLMGRGRL